MWPPRDLSVLRIETEQANRGVKRGPTVLRLRVDVYKGALKNTVVKPPWEKIDQPCAETVVLQCVSGRVEGDVQPSHSIAFPVAWRSLQFPSGTKAFSLI